VRRPVSVKVVVGLGNPGSQYVATRHNIGFRVVDLLADRLQVAIAKKEAKSLTGRGLWAGETLLLVKPQTFMNASGEAVRALVDYYRIALSDLLIIYDDLDLPLGRMRMRTKGSSGGHNGVRSIIDYMHTEVFPRLKIGIGAVPEATSGRDYVLSSFSPEEESIVQRVCSAAADAVLVWADSDVEKAMSVANAPLPAE
jgi:PTH1 family peptidyl-tRNA hydrolase